MKAAETPSFQSKHGEIPKTDCTPGSGVTWKLGQSVESIEEEEAEKPDANQSENNNNDGGHGDSRHLQRISSNCVRSDNIYKFPFCKYKKKCLLKCMNIFFVCIFFRFTFILLFRFKDLHHQQSETERIMSNSDPNKSSFLERTLSWGSKPKIMSRQRMNTFSHCQYYTIDGDE